MIVTVGLIGFFLIIVVFMAIALSLKRKRKPKQIRKVKPRDRQIDEETEKPIITQNSIDPRYGQIDSQLNLSLQIASPSVVSLNSRNNDTSQTPQN